METAFHPGLEWNNFAFTTYINTQVSYFHIDHEAIREFSAAIAGELAWIRVQNMRTVKTIQIFQFPSSKYA